MPSEAEITDTELLAILANDPNAVHINLLRRSLARPTVSQIIHIYGEDAIRAALSAASAVRSEGVELRMTPISEGLPVRDELRGEQTVLTYCEPVGTWNLVFFDSGEGEFDDGFRLGVTHWIDITEMWPGVIAQVYTSPVRTREDGIREGIEELIKELNRWDRWVIGDTQNERAGANKAKAKVVSRLSALLSQPEPKGDKA